MSKKIYAINPLTLEVEAEYASISEAGRAIATNAKPQNVAKLISKYKDTGVISHGFLWKTEI